MDVHVTLRRKGHLADDIYRQLRAAILDGSLRSGDRLPATRALAERLGVARNTVEAAYERLASEGFLVARAGAGTRVSAEAKALGAARKAPAGTSVGPLPAWRSVVTATAPSARPRYDFRPGAPDTELFPFTEWRHTLARPLRAAVLDGAYPDPAGRPDLRQAIARFVSVSRAVQAGPDDVLVTHGAQQGLDLIGRVLVQPGTCVAVEEPGYPEARQVFASYGGRVTPVPIDGEGLDASRLPDSARLVYVTPSHQFPMGMRMSLERRLALLRWAARRGAILVEDDYDTEFRFSGRPIEPIQSLDRAGRVLYLGTFSKVMLPALRLGFVVAPASLRPALVAAKRLADGGCAEHAQAALARFLDDGQLGRHIRRMTREYADRRDAILTLLARHFSEWLRPVPGDAGLHLTAVATPALDVVRAAQLAAERGVAVGTLARYFAKAPTQAGFVLGYGLIPTARIEAGMRALLVATRLATNRRG